VLLHCELIVKLEAEISYDRDQLDDIIIDWKYQVRRQQLVQVNLDCQTTAAPFSAHSAGVDLMSINLECQLRSSTVDDIWCQFQRPYQIGRAVCRQRTGDSEPLHKIVLDSEYKFATPSGMAGKFSMHVIGLESRDMAYKIFLRKALMLLRKYHFENSIKCFWGPRYFRDNFFAGYPISPEPLELRCPFRVKHLGLVV